MSSVDFGYMSSSSFKLNGLDSYYRSLSFRDTQGCIILSRSISCLHVATHMCYYYRERLQNYA